MDRRALSQLNENFKEFIAPLLDEDDPEDFQLTWEFQKFFHLKRLKIMTSESVQIKKWKQVLQSR